MPWILSSMSLTVLCWKGMTDRQRRAFIFQSTNLIWFNEWKKLHTKEILNLKYVQWLAMMRCTVCMAAPELCKNEKVTVGIHTLQKLGYLFAIWGMLTHLSHEERNPTHEPVSHNGKISPKYPAVCYSDIVHAAWHKDVCTSGLYIQNSTMLYRSV